MKKLKYMVMRLSTEITATDFFHKEIDIKLSGCAGYVPIFDTLKQAEKDSKGKYKIIPIKIGEL